MSSWFYIYFYFFFEFIFFLKLPKDFSSRLDILKMSVAYQNPALEEDFEEGVDPMTT